MSKQKQQYKTLKGFKDILPDSQKYWSFIYDKASRAAMDYGFKKLNTPILEDARLYYKGTGKHTDIVEKELYVFEDKGANKVALRPEFTPGVLRAYLEHGMVNQPQPVKLFSYGPVFRHDNPQSGRYRQFNQFNFEVIGSDNPEIDAQLIVMVDGLYRSFGIDPEIELNSIGCRYCRPGYIKKLKNYLRKDTAKLCGNCQDRYGNNPLRILDCKSKVCGHLVDGAPQILDYLCEDCKDHFVKVLEHLDDANIAYNLNPKLVRGLDYYSRTAFEIFCNPEQIKEKQTEPETKANTNKDLPKKIALGGGGRYDGLMEVLGGRYTPAVGMAGGVERVIAVLKMLKKEISDPAKADVFIAQLGEEAKKKSIRLFEQMRAEGIRVREAFVKHGLKNQLEVADKSNVQYALILGQKELLDGTIIIRDMDTGIQEIVVFDNVIDEIKKRLNGSDDVRVYNNQKSVLSAPTPDAKEPAVSPENNSKNFKIDASAKPKVQILPPQLELDGLKDLDDTVINSIAGSSEDEPANVIDKILQTEDNGDDGDELNF